ncbi:MAG: DUF4440 domain-containing protein [Candidatus Sulfotelmatobacter sp.]
MSKTDTSIPRLYSRHMIEPSLTTSPELVGILVELSRRAHLPSPGIRHHRSDFEKMMAADFWEVGASGTRYSPEFTLDELERRHAAPHEVEWETSDFHGRLGPDVYLLTHTLLQQRVRRTRRCTVWQRIDQDGNIVYQQGTIVQREQAQS